MQRLLILASAATFVLACSPVEPSDSSGATNQAASRPAKKGGSTAALPEGLEIATLAGGCFWCMETPFEKHDGVAAVISGYTGGHQKNPTYEQVCGGDTGHTEAVQVHFDPRVITYADVLQIFWRQIDPTDSGGQFVDRGSQYRPGIFYHDEAQRAVAEQSKKELAATGRFKKPIVAEITKATVFYPAEEYHQDFYKKNPPRYQSYRRNSGRDKFIAVKWGADKDYKPKKPAPQYLKPSAKELRQKLTDLQYRVTQQDATEPPFRNTYWDNKKPGIYVDVVTGEPLFSSTDKFESGTGWPSFTRPLVKEHVKTERDTKLGYVRIEVRSLYGDSHLGHVFDDGPAPTGMRYCINSAALRFIPKEKLEKEGYGEYAKLFAQ